MYLDVPLALVPEDGGIESERDKVRVGEELHHSNKRHAVCVDIECSGPKSAAPVEEEKPKGLVREGKAVKKTSAGLSFEAFPGASQ